MGKGLSLRRGWRCQGQEEAAVGPVIMHLEPALLLVSDLEPVGIPTMYTVGLLAEAMARWGGTAGQSTETLR